jgi:class 3 adenylate cyclase/CHASE2 domain-containing sensor protein
VNLKSIRTAPIVITACVLGLVCLIQALPALFPKSVSEQSPFELLQRLEWMTFDARVRWAANSSPDYASNLLAAVFIDDADIAAVNDGSLGYRFQFPWPRHLYGRAVKELSAQGASMIGFDMLFDQLSSETKVEFRGLKPMISDEYFALQIRQAGNVVLAAHSEGEVLPAELFRTNALAIGNIYTQKDSDGILRRAKAYVDYRDWHPAIQERVRSLNWNLSRARIEPARITFPRTDGEAADIVPLDKNGFLRFEDEVNLIVNPDGSEIDSQKAVTAAKPYVDLRIWHLAIILAAQQLKLDLDHPIIHRDRIILRGTNGLERIIPVDENGFFYVDWSLKLNDSKRLTTESIVRLIRQSEFREEGQTNFPAKFRDKLVFIGSIGTGGNIADQGTTPLEKETILVSQYWNVANSVILGRFVSRSSATNDVVVILLLGLLSAFLTWRLRVLFASICVLVVAVAYVGIGTTLYVENRYWIPLFFPVAGGLLMPHFSLMTYRLVFEQREQRRIKAVFSKIVAPEVVDELLSTEELSLGGARRCLTVFFSDVRGFTEFTDVSQANAEEYVRAQQLSGKAAETHLADQAREVLTTINLYLSAIADTIKKHGGTLDKYIGDCVMAFWGAPLTNEKHALGCVKAAIDAQQAICALNQERFRENKNREQGNVARAAAGQPPLPLLPLLTVGIGINTGEMTVGLMGSKSHILNYTVFGREVNVASRLEGLSGRGHIYISAATYAEIQRFDPILAAGCVKLSPVTVKGIRQPVAIFEVPWKTAPAPGRPPADLARGEIKEVK